MPQGVYRRIQRAYPERVNSLVRIDPQAQTSALVSDQLKEPLLCKCCERRLKCGGEDYFYGLVDEPGKSRIRNAVRISQSIGTGARAQPIDLKAADVDASKVAHFVLGVFWRCNVSSLSELTSYRSSLGAKFSVEIEQYLLGRGPFPEKCMIRLTSYDEEHPFAMMTQPMARRQKVDRGQFHSHMIHFLGITFEVFRGGRGNLFPRDIDLPCYGRVIFQKQFFEGSALHRQSALAVHNTQAKGKLACWLQE